MCKNGCINSDSHVGIFMTCDVWTTSFKNEKVKLLGLLGRFVSSFAHLRYKDDFAIDQDLKAVVRHETATLVLRYSIAEIIWIEQKT